MLRLEVLYEVKPGLYNSRMLALGSLYELRVSALRIEVYYTIKKALHKLGLEIII
jgi:hypothetical protein